MESFDTSAVTGMVYRRVHHAREEEAEKLMRQLKDLSRTHVGYLGSEVFPPIPGVQDAYVVLYRFDSGEHVRQWLACPERARILQQIDHLLAEPAHEFFFAHRRQHAGVASSVFSYHVLPGKQPEFTDWRRRILEEVRKWDGFLGTESFDTLDSTKPEFIVVVRFENRACLDAWLQSKIRNTLMDEVKAYVAHYDLRRIGSGFEGWFDTSVDLAPPVRWRQGLMILAALFPVIMILRKLLGPLFTIWPFPVAFLALLTIDVILLTYVIMPYFSQAMNFWLRPGPIWSAKKELAGWLILLGLIATTLAITLIYGV